MGHRGNADLRSLAQTFQWPALPVYSGADELSIPANCGATPTFYRDVLTGLPREKAPSPYRARISATVS